MKPLKVNADYEVELFHQKLAPVAINESIEFFLFYLNKHPLYSKKKYFPGFLKYVEGVTGHYPEVTLKGPFENFWGLLKDITIEKWWNSKITSTSLIIEEKWCKNTHILFNEADTEKLDWAQDYIVKDPFGMSGQKFHILIKEMSPSERKEVIHKSLVSGPIIIEPWFNRKYDFSQYVFPTGEMIAYQNIVDSKFQYKGSIFENINSPQLKNLPFYEKLNLNQWDEFLIQTKRIIDYYGKYPNECGFSIDSFIYEDNGELKIRVMSEINYRKTMGRVAYELSQKYGDHHHWTALVLTKSSPEISPLWKTMKEKNVIVLSPGDSRFEILFLKAKNAVEGQLLLDRLSRLLPNTQFTVKL
jgi:hypothetical protein